MATSDAQKKASAKYFKANMTQVKLSMPNAEAEALDSYCKDHSLTKAGFIRWLVKDAIASNRIPDNPDQTRQNG